MNDIKECIIKYFEAEIDVKAVYLYGSFVSGKYNSDSDVDIALLTNHYKDKIKSFEMRTCHGVNLSRLIGRRVDIVLLREIGELLTFQILRDGEVVYERDVDANRAFKALRILQCLDFQFLEKRMQNGMITAMKGESLGK